METPSWAACAAVSNNLLMLLCGDGVGVVPGISPARLAVEDSACIYNGARTVVAPRPGRTPVPRPRGARIHTPAALGMEFSSDVRVSTAGLTRSSASRPISTAGAKAFPVCYITRAPSTVWLSPQVAVSPVYLPRPRRSSSLTASFPCRI
ncbi:hypothetical protein SKAU_G00125370 [Synaphobranchus kaupii]|uniref:Secreted protein n=1 Tax=Synaphobranchus kaupii TaxID=118154 RepID=A0A9Q1FPW9_SYNKA|nr:hypothetical protein SKAU_G00125370 [Synaphobranchus kaupii]